MSAAVQSADRHVLLAARRRQRAAMKLAALAPVEVAPAHLEPLDRGGEVLRVGTPALSVTVPAESTRDTIALAAAADTRLHPAMQERLVQPLNDAATRTLVSSDVEWGPELAVVVRTQQEIAGYSLDVDQVVVGHLSAIRRNFPDADTRAAWVAAGVDVEGLALPLRMEMA